MNQNPPASDASPSRQWLRGLRPFVWWALLVLVLFGIREHQVWLAKTRLQFRVMLGPQRVDGEAETRLDGQPFLSGGLVSLGRHRLTITHPKAEPYLTNLVIWYGGMKLDQINLERSQGMLVINTVPPATILNVYGPEFQTNLTKSDGMTSTVPTDKYVIQSRYTHGQDNKEVVVAAKTTQRVNFSPRLGAMRIESNKEGVTFTLTDGKKERVDAGLVPALIRELPEGTYTVVTDYHGDRRESVETVSAGTTNGVRLNYVYGAAHIESKPPGATVVDGNGRQYGQTPLTLPELAPGNWQFTLNLRGHIPVDIPLSISANETNTILTNLVNEAYVNVIERARRALAQSNLEAALLAAQEAERLQPGDPESLDIQARVKTIQARLEAEARAKAEALQAAKKLAAEAEARLQAEMREQAKAKAEEKQRLEAAAKREQRPKEYFGEWMKLVGNSELFDQQEVKVMGDLAVVEAKLVRALTNEKPVFKMISLEHPEVGLFRLQAMLGLGTGGWRRCDLVGGQRKDGEVILVFKVFEYSYVEAFSIRALIGDNAEKNMVPIHSSRLAPEKRYLLPRREEGIRLIRERIRQALME